MKTVTLIMSLGGVLLLSGCAGTSSEFECNATTSDSCMTMEKANEKAKTLEEGDRVKPVAASLPRLADGNFSTAQRDRPATNWAPIARGQPARQAPSAGGGMLAQATSHAVPVTTGLLTTRPANPWGNTGAAAYASQGTPSQVGGRNPAEPPRPLRNGEQVASLWIAPWVDNQDVYHQPSTVFFIVKKSAWGKPRIN